MDEAKVLVAKRTKKRLALYRVVLSCPWVILWIFVFTHQYSLNIDLRFINLLLYPGIIFFSCLQPIGLLAKSIVIK